LPGVVTPTAWIPPQALTLEQWTSVGKVLGRADTMMNWLLGDWWSQKFAYGDKCRVLAATCLGRDLHTLTNYGTVSRAFATTSRRRDILSWSHHAEVAALLAREADALLDRAEREKLSCHALRLLVADRHAEDLADRQAMLDEPLGVAEDSGDADSERFEGEAASIQPPPKHGHDGGHGHQHDEDESPAPLPKATDEQMLAMFNQFAGGLYGFVAHHDPVQIFVPTHIGPSRLRIVAHFLERVAAGIEGRTIEHDQQHATMGGDCGTR
jgi:hypothetical protein